MRKVKLKYQHVMSIITHYHSNLKSSRDIKNAFMSFPESGYIRCHMSSSIRLFICCHSNCCTTLSSPRSSSKMADQNPMDTNSLLQQLMGTVSSIWGQIAETKSDRAAAEENRSNPQKRPRDGNSGAGFDTEANRDGNDGTSSGHDDDRDSDEGEEGDNPSVTYQLSEEGEAFIQTAFASRLKYQTRQAKAAKYGTPDSKWLKCPELSPVVEATLSKDAVKQDQAIFRSQQMWLEAARPLTACLERAHEGTLTVHCRRLYTCCNPPWF